MGKNANKRKSNQKQPTSKKKGYEEVKHNPWGNTGYSVKVVGEKKKVDDWMGKDEEDTNGSGVLEAVRGKITRGRVGKMGLVFVALGILVATVGNFVK